MNRIKLVSAQFGFLMLAMVMTTPLALGEIATHDEVAFHALGSLRMSAGDILDDDRLAGIEGGQVVNDLGKSKTQLQNQHAAHASGAPFSHPFSRGSNTQQSRSDNSSRSTWNAVFDVIKLLNDLTNPVPGGGWIIDQASKLYDAANPPIPDHLDNGLYRWGPGGNIETLVLPSSGRLNSGPRQR